MPGKKCYHCRQIIPEKDRKTHDCWTTTEDNLTRDLPENLKEAWERLRETATSFGEQRIYASHKSIMFARKTCYFFVRPKKKVLEVCFFLGRTLKGSRVKSATRVSKLKVAHLVLIEHRDEVEPPLTEWLAEAYEANEALRQKPRKKGVNRL